MQESKDIFVQESCDDMDTVLPTNVEFDIVEYESFSRDLDKIECLDVGFYVEYESFFFDPIITYHLFEPSKSEFLEFETFVPITVDLGQTH